MWNARKIINNNLLIFLSIVYLFVGTINFFHLLSYQGMPIFRLYSITLSSQLWIAERFLLAVSMPVSLLFVNRKLNRPAAILIYLVVTYALLMSIYAWKIFPVTFIEGKGLTHFKVYAEYVIIALFFLGMALLYKYRDKFNTYTYRLLILSMVFNVAAEFLFTLYTNIHAPIMVLAHTILLFSYFLLYKALIEIGLTDPYRLIFLEMGELNKRKDELLSVTSHELKNPFTSIKLYSQLLDKELGKVKHNVKICHLVRQIRLQTDKINHILGDLNDIAKINSGQMVIKKQAGDPSLFLMEIVENFRLRYPRRKLILKAKKVSPISYDSERIGQVIENLIENAIKYSKDNSPVTIGLAEKNNSMVFSVRDRGIGISAKNLPRIFDKYYRADYNYTARGLGLGLYISKEIIDKHQGKIWVKSRPKAGSVFYFSLPL